MKNKVVYLLLAFIITSNLQADVKNKCFSDSTKNTLIDSVRHAILHKSIQDSLIQFLYIVEDETEAFATPDIDFIINTDDTVTIMLLDSNKEFKKVLLNKYLIKGHYRVNYKSGTFKLLQEYLNNKIIFFILIITSKGYEYQKGILIK